ncbi:endonuclease domain-containing protein [Demequina sp. B12]|uniref:endonuclease domain-containing protein n=1 Tax=Demequina sp. B12 TaxID=2992757 RepID=UPI00237A1D2D|nr:DUF559 domain-containing protein [Demequina sp. B12]MDE0573494.1 endonuclease domain-containing protein [Demequina sp. B12]
MKRFRAFPQCSHPREIADVLAATWHAFPRHELVAASSDFAVRRALERGEIVKVTPHHYAHAQTATSFWTRADAVASWLGTRGILSGSTALYIAGEIAEPPRVINALIPRKTRIVEVPDWVRITHAKYSPLCDVVNGWEIVDPAMALVQAYGRLPHESRDGVVLGALARGRISREEMRRCFALMPRIKDRQLLKQLLEDSQDGAESVLERDAHRDVFGLRDFGSFIKQFDVVVGGQRYRLDMYHPGLRIAVELDGAAFHATQGHWQRDLNRDAALLAQGIVSVRFSYWDIKERPQWCRDTLRAVMAQRAKGGALAVEK